MNALLSFSLVVVAGVCLGSCSEITCRCDESIVTPPARCFRDGLQFALKCGNSDKPGVCFTQWNIDNGKITATIWDCAQELHELTFLSSHYCIDNMNVTNNGIVRRCCNDTDFCNDNLILVLSTPTPPPLTSLATPTPTPAEDRNSTTILYLSLTISLPIVSLIIIAVSVTIPILIVYLRYRKKRHRSRTRNRNNYTANGEISYELSPVNITDLDDLNEMSMSSGSGSGLPFLVQRTVARSIKIADPIGNGRYGQVFIGHYQGELVAVKKFASRDEKSWRRETEIYNTVLLRHDNILGFFASDMVSNNGVTELWLITQFHQHGALFDYLNKNVVSSRVMLQMAISTCSGLAHLHTELFGTQAKPAIAHRDIKSKNILVKNNLTCVIADFGLAVMKESGNKVNVAANPRQGTKRYMAPEILNETIDMSNFESFKQTDVYALGLVLWEICRKCEGSEVGRTEEYELPFQGLVPPDPSFDDMKRLVVIERRQPTIPNRWLNDELLREIVRVMRECWYFTPSARPTSLYLKKKLLRFATEENKLNYSEHE